MLSVFNKRYFIVLDDDYTSFSYAFNDKYEYFRRDANINSFDKIISILLKYFHHTSQIKCLAIAQGGDFIGGAGSTLGSSVCTKRKIMNFFICDTHRPFQFVSKLNEDVNTYLVGGHRGDVYLTTSQLRLEQAPTQTNAGGMTDIYVDSGTYVKSFFSVMYSPSSVKVTTMGLSNRRIHHRINWSTTTPKIIRESHRKKD